MDRTNIALFLLSLSSLLALPAPAHGLTHEAGGLPCPEAEELALDTTVRGSGAISPNPQHHFRLVVPAAGILALDVSSPIDAPVQPKIALSRARCSGASRAGVGAPAIGFRLLRATPTALVAEIRAAGTYFVTVSAEEPRRALGGYKLRTAFASLPGGGALADLGAREITEIKDDPVGEPSSPDGGDPGPMTSSSSRKGGDEVRIASLAGVTLELCTRGEVDDHGDTWLCATPLRPGEPATGVLDNAAGDDEDTFSFPLTEQETVAIEAVGQLGLWVRLYDERGHRLSLAEETGDGRRFRAVTTLGPGRYTLRLESWHPGERYRLRVAPLPSF